MGAPVPCGTGARRGSHGGPCTTPCREEVPKNRLVCRSRIPLPELLFHETCRAQLRTGEYVRGMPTTCTFLHESPSPETPGFVRGGGCKTFLGGSGGLRVLWYATGWRARSRPALWRSTMCSLMVLALDDTAEPHQQQRYLAVIETTRVAFTETPVSIPAQSGKSPTVQAAVAGGHVPQAARRETTQTRATNSPIVVAPRVSMAMIVSSPSIIPSP